MRIIFFIGAFFPRPTGATYSALRLAFGLREQHGDVAFIVDDRGPDWRGGGVHDGFRVQSFSLHGAGKWKKLRGLAALTRHLLARRKDFDIFHVHGGGYVNLFIAWWAKFICGKPVLMKITSDGWDTPDGMLAEKWGTLSLFAYRRLDGVVAMTSGQARKCSVWNLPAQIAVIPNGVDCERHRPATPGEKMRLRDELNIPRDAFVLCYLGWLGHGKGTDVLIEIWQRLRQLHDNVFLLLVGDYVDEHTAGVTHIDPPPQSPWLRLVGRVDDAERYLQASDVFVFPSRREGFGTVQIEAMACGLPCVVNDLPGVTEDIFPDETCGFRIAGNRVEDFVRRIEQVLSDPVLRETMGRAARVRAVENFSSASIVRRYLDFYKRLTVRTA